MTTCPLCGHENPDGSTVCAACDHGDHVAEPSPPASFFGRMPWHTRRFLIVVYMLAAAIGFVAPREGSDLEFILGIGGPFAAAWWAITDASDRGRPMRTGTRLLVILLGALAAPIYLIWTRGWRGIIWLVLIVAGYLAAATIGAIVSVVLRSLLQ